MNKLNIVLRDAVLRKVLPIESARSLNATRLHRQHKLLTKDSFGLLIDFETIRGLHEHSRTREQCGRIKGE